MGGSHLQNARWAAVVRQHLQEETNEQKRNKGVSNIENRERAPTTKGKGPCLAFDASSDLLPPSASTQCFRAGRTALCSACAV